MTTSVKVRYDGKVLVPEQPVDLPVGSLLDAELTPSKPIAKPALERLVESVGEIAEPDKLPVDGSAQHDHYLYGLPKK